jgi:hypothetical protein
LHIVVTWTMPFLGISFSILPVIRSCPRDFLGLRSFLYYVLNFLWCKEFDSFLHAISVNNATIYFHYLTMNATCFSRRRPSSGVPLC